MANPANEKVILTAQYYGDSGGSTTYYYWVQAVYNWGNGGLSNVAAATVLSLSHNNVVSLNWTPQPTSQYFNVFRNTSNTPPAAGAVTFCIAQISTADGLVDNGLPTFTITMLAAGPQEAMTPEQAKSAAAAAEKAAAEEAKKTPEQKAAEASAAQKKADEEQKKIDEEIKKSREEAEKKTDELLKELETTQKAADDLAAKDAERAAKLNRLYNERYQLGVRTTDAQKQATKEQEKPHAHK